MTSTPETLKVLRSASLFHGIPDHLLTSYLRQSRLEHVTSGHTLLTPGQPNDTIYLILSGRLRIQAKEFSVEPIAILGAGECVGEMSMLGGAPVSAYAIAATDCKLLAINHTTMWELINDSHAAAHNMLNILTSRIRSTNQLAALSLERQHGFSARGLVDELTGLYSQHGMREKVERHLQRSIAGGEPGCLLLLEIDSLSEFSEQYGQLGGDQALRNLTYLVLSCLRPHDEAGRNSSESFAVFMPNTSLPHASTAAERLKARIAQSAVVLPSGDALPAITISIGISQTRPADTLENLFARAGESLQLAKDSGGNCIRSMP